MKAMLLPALFSLSLATISPAQTCREVVRDASGQVVQTIDRQKSAGGSVQATTRDASGRIIGTATSNPNAGSSAQTDYRDASGRSEGRQDRQRLTAIPPVRHAPPTGMPVGEWPEAPTPELAADPPALLPSIAMPQAD